MLAGLDWLDTHPPLWPEFHLGVIPLQELAARALMLDMCVFVVIERVDECLTARWAPH
jgi:hypothetical protein